MLQVAITNKIQFSLITAFVFYYVQMNNQNVSSLRLITPLYNSYIYIFTMKRYNIFSLNEFPIGTIIGMDNQTNPFLLYYKKFFTDLGYEETVDYKTKFYSSVDELFRGFIKKECTIMIVFDIFPNPTIASFLDRHVNEEIILLPFEIRGEDLFRKKNQWTYIKYIDLNQLSKSYLPKKFSNFIYTPFRPNIRIAYTYEFLISNVQTDDVYTYSFIYFLYMYAKSLNQNTLQPGYHLQIQQIDNFLEYHNGALHYFHEFGHISNIDNENCKYLVGKMACNLSNLKKNNFL